MELTHEAVQQIQQEVKAAASRGVVPAGLTPKDICDNKDLILGFLKMLAGVIPGAIGKIVAQIVVAAAQAWFDANCKK